MVTGLAGRRAQESRRVVAEVGAATTRGSSVRRPDQSMMRGGGSSGRSSMPFSIVMWRSLRNLGRRSLLRDALRMCPGAHFLAPAGSGQTGEKLPGTGDVGGPPRRLRDGGEQPAQVVSLVAGASVQADQVAERP